MIALSFNGSSFSSLLSKGESTLSFTAPLGILHYEENDHTSSGDIAMSHRTTCTTI